MTEQDTSVKSQANLRLRNAKGQFVSSHKIAPSIWSFLFSRKTSQMRLTPEEIKIRMWAFVVFSVVFVFVCITFMMLYSLTFVEQPMKAMAPIDQAYTKMLNDIVLLIVGAIGGIASEKGLGMVSTVIAKNHEEQPKWWYLGS